MKLFTFHFTFVKMVLPVKRRFLQPQPGHASMCIEVLSTFKESFKPLVTPHIEKNRKACNKIKGYIS